MSRMAQTSVVQEPQSLSPQSHSIAIADLRPTQMTVGMREVRQKSKEWRELPPAKRPAFLGRHMIPVVRGPKDRFFLIDHHHLARALHDESVVDIAVAV